MSKDRVTLDRVLSKLGLCSRSDAAESIRAGCVAVNGKIIRDPDHWVTLKEDQIKFAGQDLRTHKRVYLALNKPTGVVTTYRDPQGRSTIYDFIKKLNAWVFPVGRLDKDTSGLLLLTNDTHLGETLTNPCSKVPKTYLVKINLHPSLEQLERLRSGITLKSGETTLPANIRVLRQSQKCTFLEMIIVEGKNRQVRRMIEAIGGKVLKLTRTRIGGLELGDLPPGGFRFLDKKDLAMLREKDSRSCLI